MRNKKKSKLIVALSFSLVAIMSSQTVAFAKIDEDVASLLEVGEVLDVPLIAEVEKVPLTPEGNLTLVDDVVTDDIEDKQFITAVSKNGNFFYIVIDRVGDNDNVYLLNLVDEADLMALMEGTPVTIKQEEEPVVIEEVVEVEEIEEEPVVEEKKNSTLPIILTLLVLVGGGAFYYLKFIKVDEAIGGDDFDEFDDDDEDNEEYEGEENSVNEEQDMEEVEEAPEREDFEDEKDYDVPDDLDEDKLEDYANDDII